MTDPVILQRGEGAVIALLMIVALYFTMPPWWLVVLVLIAPDLSMAAYWLGPRLGAAIYNLAHWLVLPILLGMADMTFQAMDAGLGLGTMIAMIWTLHIAIDRALGYGLKHPTGFRDTHLGRIGRGR